MKILKAACGYERAPFIKPFEFKGNALTEAWHTVVRLTGENGCGIGLGVQSVLWSDAAVFAKNGEEAGNRLMLDITKFAANQATRAEAQTPAQLFEELFESARSYAKNTVGAKVRDTFVLNALVPVDFAAWLLYAREKNISSFDAFVPQSLKERHNKLANVPLITYNTSIDEVIRLAQDGTCLFKIKIGSDPDKDGSLDKMLEWDKARLLEIHKAVKDYPTPHTKSARPLYYLDANGRYDSKDRLLRLIDFADKIGALDKIAILEEPFAEENFLDVGDIPVTVAADESAHCLKDVRERAQLGYKAIALKPIAKTLSATLEIADFAARNNIVCFCADLTVNPIMVEWNKNVAARLMLLEGMKIGIVESNGRQNYTDWDKMLSYHPLCDEEFVKCKNGIFELDKRFYETSGGIFEPMRHYQEVLGNV